MAISLGDINFGLGADTSGLDASIRRLQNFGKAVDAAAKSTSDAASKTERALRNQEAAMVAMVTRVQNLSTKYNKSTFGQTYIEEAQKALDAYIRSMSSKNLSPLGFQRANEQMRVGLADIERRFKGANIGPPEAKLSLWQKFMEGIGRASNVAFGPLSAAGGKINALTSIMSGAGGAVTAFAGGMALAATAVYAVGERAVKAGVKIQNLNSMMLAVTGSQEGSNKAIREAADISNRTGAEVNDVAIAYARWNSAIKGTAIEGDKGRAAFEGLLLAVSKLGLDSTHQAGALLALEQMMSKGRVSREELVKQLGNDIPGAFETAQRAMGVYGAEFDALMKKGIKSEDFVPKFVTQLRKDLSLPDSGGSVNNYNAATNRLSNSSTVLFAEIDRGLGITQSTMDAINGTAKAIDTLTGSLHSWFGTKGETFNTLTAMEEGLAGQTKSWNAINDDIEIYIRKQGQAAGATRETTQAFIDQLTAQAKAAQVQLQADKAKFPATIGPNTSDTWTNWLRQGWNRQTAGTHLEGLFNPKDIVAENNKEMEQLNKQIDEYQKKIDALQKILTKQPDAAKTADALPKLVDNAELDKQVKAFMDAGGKIQGDSKLTADTLIQGINDQIKATEAQIAKTDSTTATYDALIIKAEQYRKALEDLVAIQKQIGTLGSGGPATGTNPLLSPINYKPASQQIRITPASDSVDGNGNQIPAQFALIDVAGEKSTGAVASMTKAIDNFPKIAVPAVQKVTESFAKYGNVVVKVPQVTITATTQAEQAMAKFNEIGSHAIDSFANNLIDSVIQGKDIFESLKSTALSVLSDMLKAIVQFTVLNPLKNALFGGSASGGGGGSGILGSIFGSLFGARKGAAFDGPVVAMRKGGLINSATMFATGAGNVLAGEAGREAIMPLGRNSKGELGVRASGGGGNVFNIYAQDAQSVIRSETQVAASMQRALSRGSRNL